MDYRFSLAFRPGIDTTYAIDTGDPMPYISNHDLGRQQDTHVRACGHALPVIHGETSSSYCDACSEELLRDYVDRNPLPLDDHMTNDDNATAAQASLPDDYNGILSDTASIPSLDLIEQLKRDLEDARKDVKDKDEAYERGEIRRFTMSRRFAMQRYRAVSAKLWDAIYPPLSNSDNHHLVSNPPDPTRSGASTKLKKTVSFAKGIPDNPFRHSHTFSRHASEYRRGRHAAPHGKVYVDNSGARVPVAPPYWKDEDDEDQTDDDGDDNMFDADAEDNSEPNGAEVGTGDPLFIAGLNSEPQEARDFGYKFGKCW